jgi:hypothetical protein
MAKFVPPPSNQRKGPAAGISYNASQGLYKNMSTVCLGTDNPEYVRSNFMPDCMETHSNWRDYKGAQDPAFMQKVKSTNIKLGSDDWFYTKSSTREMLEVSGAHGFNQNAEKMAAQRDKNMELQKKLRRSQIVLGAVSYIFSEECTDRFII